MTIQKVWRLHCFKRRRSCWPLDDVPYRTSHIPAPAHQTCSRQGAPCWPGGPNKPHTSDRSPRTACHKCGPKCRCSFLPGSSGVLGASGVPPVQNQDPSLGGQEFGLYLFRRNVCDAGQIWLKSFCAGFAGSSLRLPTASSR